MSLPNEKKVTNILFNLFALKVNGRDVPKRREKISPIHCYEILHMTFARTWEMQNFAKIGI